MTGLTPSNDVDVGALAGLFRATTNSYKHLFFQGLLSLLRDRAPEDRVVALEALAVEMVARAWFPHVYFRLSFGRQGQVGRILDRLAFSPEGGAIGNAANQRALRAAIRAQAEAIGLPTLLRYVPYRLLEPFFGAEVAGLPDARKNDRLRALSAERFAERRPLYRFVETGEEAGVEIHPAWMAYLQANQAIVEGWAERHWLAFLQGRNPTTPALTEKIRPPAQRRPLTAQTRFWATVLAEAPLPCLYSGESLDPNRFALDHFVPWAFVCHDRLWNLVPVHPELNSAKGHALPDEAYLPELARIQARGLSIFRDRVGPGSAWFGRTVEAYLADLGLPEDRLTDRDALTEAYEMTLKPLLGLAQRSGFPSGWRYLG